MISITPGNKTDNPCYQCDKRAVGCHATCAAYIEWKQATAEKSEAAKKRKAYMDATGYEISKAIKMRVRSDIIKRGKGE